MRISDWSSDVCSSDLGKLEQLRTADPARRQDAFLTDTRLIAMPRLVTVGGARGGPVFEQKMIEARLGADGEQRVAAHRLEVGRGGRAAAAVVGRRLEEAGTGRPRATIGRGSGRGRGCQYVKDPGG